jgi:hypothetical protein
MLSKLGVAVTALGLATGALALNNSAHAQGVQVGVLTCNLSSGLGFIVGSSRAVDCTFSSPNGEPAYYGREASRRQAQLSEPQRSGPCPGKRQDAARNCRCM